MKLVFIFFLGAHKFAESTERGTGVLQSTFAMAASGQMPVTTLEEGWQQLKSQAIEPLCKEHAHLLRKEDEAEENEEEEEEEEDEEEWEDEEIRPPSHAAGGSFRF